jgi:hypothetical protein
MKVIAADLRQVGDEGWLADVVGSCHEVGQGPRVKEPVAEYLRKSPGVQRGLWFTCATLLLLGRAKHVRTQTSGGCAYRGSATNQRSLSHLLNLFASDVKSPDVVGLWFDMKEHGNDSFFAERRRILGSLEKGGNSSTEAVGTELKALEFLEKNLAEVDLFLSNIVRCEDFSVRLGVQVFERWIDRKLKAEGFGFRLLLDRRTSTYRVVPREACSNADRPDRVELRLISPHTVLSACLIAYLTRLGLQGRVEGWIEAVDLIDRLAFGGVLELVLRCPVCGRWMYALHSRREYCGDKCRYKVWAKTPKGRDRRRKASADYRRRITDAIVSATPNVKRRRRNP